MNARDVLTTVTQLSPTRNINNAAMRYGFSRKIETGLQAWPWSKQNLQALSTAHQNVLIRHSRMLQAGIQNFLKELVPANKVLRTFIYVDVYEARITLGTTGEAPGFQ